MESMRNLHIVLFIGVMCVVQTSQDCPYIDSRCSCKPKTVSCDNLQQIPPLITGASVIPSLSFNGGNITSISINSLPPGLTSISLDGHPLTNISEDAFNTSATTLKEIVFRNLNLNSLPTALKKLTNLTSLTIQNTRIQDWDTATLTKIATKLETLVLINVGLYTWPSWIVDFHLLSKLDLSRNTLYSIPNDAFISINNSLRHLDLSGTGLTHLPQALSTLSSLKRLYLNNNNFIVSEIEQLSRLPFARRLSYLSLDSTGLSRVPNISNLTNLFSLRLSGNRLCNPPAGVLPKSLVTVYLNDSSLRSVPTDIANLSRTTALFIDRNYITDIEPNSFPLGLSYLSMSGNRIYFITNTTFRNLNLLVILQLSYNPIRIISYGAFSDLVYLRFLSMTYSHLTEIPLAFARLNSHVNFDFSTTQPLACPCPASQELVQWFTSLTNVTIFNASCSNGQSIGSYFRGQCNHLPANL